MEQRVFKAIFLSIVLFMVWGMFFAPKPEDQPKEGDSSTDEQSSPENPGDATGASKTDETSPGGPVPKTVDVAIHDGPLVLKNEVLRLEFSQKGGALKSGWLLEHGKEPGDSAKDGYNSKLEFIRTYEGGRMAFGLGEGSEPGEDPDFLERTPWSTTGPAADGKSLSFSIDIENQGDRYRLTKTFRLTDKKGRILVELAMASLDAAKRDITRAFWLNTSGGVFPPDRTTPGGAQARALSHSLVGTRGEDGEIILTPKAVGDILDGETPDFAHNAFLACDTGVYFGAYFRHLEGGKIRGTKIRAVSPADLAKEGATKADLERVGPPRTYTQMVVLMTTSDASPEVVAKYDYYLGPKDFSDIRESYGDDADVFKDYLAIADTELTAQGFCCLDADNPINRVVQMVARAVLWLLSFFYNSFGSMGISIIVLTLCVRTLMFPVTRKSQVAMQRHAKKMGKLKPKLEKLKEKYKDDQQKFAQEQMKLFKAEGVSVVPLGGCLPMFLQIPIFFGLFSAIRFAVDLRHAEFLWCQDLSKPDMLYAFETAFNLPCCIGPGVVIDGFNLFPVLMIFAMFFHQMGMPKSEDPQMQQQQKMMLMMPFMFGIFMYSYAAGLSVYWLTSSCFGIIEQRVIKKLFPIDGKD